MAKNKMSKKDWESMLINWEDARDITLAEGFKPQVLADDYPEILKLWSDYVISERLMTTVLVSMADRSNTPE